MLYLIKENDVLEHIQTLTLSSEKGKSFNKPNTLFPDSRHVLVPLSFPFLLKRAEKKMERDEF